MLKAIGLGSALCVLTLATGCAEEPVRQTGIVVDSNEAARYNIPEGVIEAELAKMAEMAEKRERADEQMAAEADSPQGLLEPVEVDGEDETTAAEPSPVELVPVETSPVDPDIG